MTRLIASDNCKIMLSAKLNLFKNQNTFQINLIFYNNFINIFTMTSFVKADRLYEYGNKWQNQKNQYYAEQEYKEAYRSMKLLD